MTDPQQHADSATEPLIEAVGISKSFQTGRRAPAVDVLDGVSLRVNRGEFVAIVGPSGSGKSTLLYCLSSLEAPTSGDVRIAGTAVGGLRQAELARFRRDTLGFVFQQFNLIPSLSARENVALAGRLARRRDAADRADQALAAVGLADRARHTPGRLSGGQQQRVAIARALAADPEVVFADEPTGSLDGAAGARVLALLRSLASGERSVVMVTHDLDAATLADRVLVLRDGRIHAEITTPTRPAILAALDAATSTGVAEVDA
ncbi:ABC transporter ATP-binding protein [Rathayibacter rathayi]|uniref:ABC transporter ATP-binding protein n=1 Tax=Rathayibacter rathayi TaxID=33887 RepID=A0ABX5A8Q8_RATRA|nr:ABC transporter ATP-binding protein [Rathayibacter rathayi]AZZ49998.1 ABC transporter ATP-binding protein [Rathayibacter rathayi]MWV75285.1 ATP-binding cassette domain-containing protein [Rathayibacter rathayi NCPPB 2980 = VKM Ac-1601]PPF23081.1 ABC transporter ATP-binding protein [Rathayibacter rathayi]PPF46357.1 ABC transporter ATP-binding protein [Rathayibacter rathayi]PPG67138.1 ABC transporter ATP-binding protein [Rathayibacter rathayi]